MIAIKTLMDEWKTKHTSDPDLSVIARLTGLPIERVQKTMPFIRQWETLPVPPLSLDADVGENESSLYSFLIDPDLEEAVDAAQRSEVWSAIEKLSPRERYIMRLRFLEGHTLEETGDILKLTRARIKQIQDDALRKLRQILRRGIKNPRM
jgi:RNA polymerase primary sigma factor